MDRRGWPDNAGVVENRVFCTDTQYGKARWSFVAAPRGYGFTECINRNVGIACNEIVYNPLSSHGRCGHAKCFG